MQIVTVTWVVPMRLENTGRWQKALDFDNVQSTNSKLEEDKLRSGLGLKLY